ncbi:fasciclin domain-containing protein [Parerythrobacter jejuensis]|uniref:Fasciclin domain-containing protein n=1 Tax=Parerythrobacter jejuensis TaxID=795812 RepID=A0A845AQR2_9SPHN|nr:fasciclin domain-containing protein [Parerythrobacter jejuensis]MXP31523.1 fasciclin domain-containing protein [Parerythrobacter jejuensis]
MSITKNALAAVSAIAMLGGGAIALSQPAMAHHTNRAASQPNIVQTAQSTGVHNTLVAAVTAADLGGTLSTGGPFTVFAPTDTAFNKLPDGTVANLVKPENKGTLTSILTYHVVDGRVSAADLTAAIQRHNGSFEITTLAGNKLTARLSGNNIVITDGAGRATAVTQADVNTSNGVIHVTDGVFLPG